MSAALVVSLWPIAATADAVEYNTAQYWTPTAGILAGMGPDQSSTTGETFIAPQGGSVTLDDFSFYAQSYYGGTGYSGGVAHLDVQAFVFAWSGSMTGKGGGAIGNAFYLGPSFQFDPPDGGFNGPWTALTATIGGSGLTLNPGQDYVLGFTVSNPSDYAASSGDIEFQEVPARNPYEPPLPPGAGGGGGAVWDNNGNNFGALNTATWDTWGDTGDLAFTADFTTAVPDVSSTMLMLLGSAFGVMWCARRLVPIRPGGANCRQ
jgi:hypothetical protein